MCGWMFRLAVGFPGLAPCSPWSIVTCDTLKTFPASTRHTALLLMKPMSLGPGEEGLQALGNTASHGHYQQRTLTWGPEGSPHTCRRTSWGTAQVTEHHAPGPLTTKQGSRMPAAEGRAGLRGRLGTGLIASTRPRAISVTAIVITAY
jgi:hypothetical protein